jgi:transcriptional regulator with XRE-family HTH domain
MNLGERVHLLRRRLGWTQRELGELAKINPNNVARIERSDIKDPGGKLVARLAQALGTSTDYLLGLTEESGVESETMPTELASAGRES